MTNGEKLKEIFPNGVLTSINNSYYWGDDILVSKSFWNAEYKEPNKSEIPTGSTIKDDLALIHTWGLDEEIRCIMCTNHMKSDRGCDGSCVVNKNMYNAVMDAIEKRIQSTTKNDLTNDVPDINVGSIEPIIDKIRTEIEKQEKWLLQAGYNAYNVDIAFWSIKSVLTESEDKNGNNNL